MEYTLLLCVVAAFAVIGLAAFFNAIRITQEYERLVVFRLGRCIGQKGPGLVLLIPFIDRGAKVDLREQVREIPHQTSITLDNAPIAIDFIWCDEEPPEDVYAECCIRTMTTRGHIILTFTPLQGITNVVKGFTESYKDHLTNEEESSDAGTSI